MKTILKIISCSYFSLAVISIYAQGDRPQSLSIGIDPLVIGVLNGFEVEAAYSFGKNRIAVEYLGAELPAVWNSQIDDFEKVSASIFEIAYSRFIRSDQKGFHYGLAFSQFSNFEVETEGGQTLSKDISKLGLRLGFIWFPFKKVNFFVEPLFNFGFYLNDEELDFGNGQLFEKVSFAGSGPVLHLGWKFDLN